MSSNRFTVYQIDFAAAAAGKRIAAAKRRLRWRFGFPNKQALEAGRTGTDCRGEEHEVDIVWSITSGKRQISMDGKEVHFSSSRAGVLDFSWTTRGNHVIKVLCHAAAPMTPTPGFRQYDLFIDGQSFFNMPKVYELGIKGSVPSRVPGGYSNPTSPVSYESGSMRGVPSEFAPSSREQEEADLRMAIQASLEESRQHLSRGTGGGGSVAPTTHSEANLLDFGSPAPQQFAAPPSDRSVSGMSYYSAPPTYTQQPPPPAPAPYQSPPPAAGNYAGALVPSHGPPGSYYQAPPQPYGSPAPVPPAAAPQPAYGAAPPTYAPPPPVQTDVFGMNSMPDDDPFAPKPPAPPTRQDYTNAILEAYQSPAVTPMAARPPATAAPGSSPPPQPQGQFTPQSMGALTNTEVEEAPMSALEKAMKNLVNVDHIDEPAEGEVKLTMIKKEEAKKKQPGNKSTPLPPVATNLVGKGASLAQIRETKHGDRTLKQTSDGVMNAPPPGVFSPGAAAGGALVVHGQGPPPLNQPQGFGLGARLPNGGFAQQQPAPLGYQQQYR
eukprot:Nitzschia sp. Nitz4//scaffold61_size107673//71490//73388//NITZ4_004246-RA/size107673-snap-gene-0.118-mRNA-1//-1//CDS//3329555743//4299//frame0